jgi:hypothetical protein
MKTMILGEFVATTGMHRKAVIRLLNRGSSVEVSRRRGRQRQYGAGAAEALKVVWEIGDMGTIIISLSFGVLNTWLSNFWSNFGYRY